jgi:hypothetical protein
MTVSSSINQVLYSGNGTTVLFPVNYYFLQDSHLQVILVAANGTETVQTLTTNYTVTGAGNEAGGSITMLVAPPTGTQLIIVRNVPATQETDYLANDPFPAESHERALDKLTMLVQQNKLESDRALKVPLASLPTTDTELPIPVGNKLLAWNSNASAIVNFDPADVITITGQQNSYADVFTGNGVTTDFTLTRNPGTVFNIDVSINGVTQVPNVDYILAATTLTFTSAPPAVASQVLARYSEVFTLVDGDAANIRYLPAGGVQTNVQTKLRETVSVKDFGAVGDGVTDDTAAIQAAAAYLDSIGGGTILIPTASIFLMNWVCLYNNIVLNGQGGSGEYDLAVIRPYSISSPAIQFGDGTSIVRYCGMNRVHISGTDGSATGVTNAANNAPQCFKLAGGVVNFHANECVFYNGVQTVALVPSATQPVTTNCFTDCTIRNDLTDSASARAIYIIRLADPGYATANKFTRLKLNGPTLGYAAEIDGTITGILFEVTDSYWDIKPDHGVLLKGSSQLAGFNTQIDPGATGVVVIESDADADISRFIVGYLRNGGQQFKTPSYTYTLPSEADTFSYRARMKEAYLSNATYFTTDTDPYNTTTAIQYDGTNIALAGSNFVPQTTNSKTIGDSSNRWAESWATKVYAGDSTSFWTSGGGSPEGVVTATVGSLYTNRGGGAGTTLYVKESGSGNTGWVAK